MTVATLPLRAVNTSNVREHWAARAKRTKAHRNAARLALRGLAAERNWLTLGGRLVVTLTRIAPRPLDSHDGLPASLKAVADGVTDALGLGSDGDRRMAWLYTQERAGVGEYAVRVELRMVAQQSVAVMP